MMKRSLAAGLVALLITAAAPPAGAQRGAPDNPRRAELEQQVRQRMARMLRERVGLTDEQFEQLVQVNRRFDDRRRTLVEQERDVRIGLRQEVLREDKADQERVARLVEQAIQVQRQRLQLLEEEQRALADFLTPLQRAKYMAVQEQIHRALEEMRRPGAGRAPGARRPG
jgi:Spy/CpxP family protein refolding chaperone